MSNYSTLYLSIFTIPLFLYYLYKLSSVTTIVNNIRNNVTVNITNVLDMTLLLILMVIIVSIGSGELATRANRSIKALDFVYLALPWIIILGSILLMITKLPRVLEPFANTIGYLFKQLQYWSDGKMRNVIPQEAVDILNEFSTVGFSTQFSKLTDSYAEVKRVMAKTDMEPYISMVVSKDIISQAVWIILGGLVSISIMSSTIATYD